MIFQIPDTMPPQHYRAIDIHGVLNLGLFLLFAAILIIFGVLFLFNARKQELESVKKLKMGFGLFGIFYGVCRIFFIIAFQDFTNPDLNYDIYTSLAYSTGMVGFTTIIYGFEQVKYEKRYFTIIAAIITILTIVGTVVTILRMATIREMLLAIIWLGTPISGLMLFFLYLNLIKLSTGIVKKKAIFSLLGFFIMVVGISLDSQVFLAIEWIPIWVKMDIVPILCIVGYLIFSINQY